ncbi:MAG: hypothetical protein AB1646_16185 [Thermodesulfobacteriota bacterium]
MRPVEIEIVAMTTLDPGCGTCGMMFAKRELFEDHARAWRDEYPEDCKQDELRLIEALKRLRQLYRHRIRCRVVDAQSPLGLWRKIRHQFYDLPAFIVDGSEVCTGWDMGRLEALIDRRIHAAPES